MGYQIGDGPCSCLAPPLVLNLASGLPHLDPSLVWSQTCPSPPIWPLLPSSPIPTPHLAPPPKLPLSAPPPAAPVWPPHLAAMGVPLQYSFPMFSSISLRMVRSHLACFPPCKNNICHLVWKNSQNCGETTPFPSIRYSTSHQQDISSLKPLTKFLILKA